MPRGVRPALPRESFRLDAAKMNELPQLIEQYEEAIEQYEEALVLADWRKAKIAAALEDLPSNERLAECCRFYWDFPELIGVKRLVQICEFPSQQEFLIEARKYKRVDVE